MAASEPRGPQVMQHPGPEKELCGQIMPQNAHASQGAVGFGFDPSAPDYGPALAAARTAFLERSMAEKNVAPATEEQGPAPAEEQSMELYPLLDVADVMNFPALEWKIKGLIPSVGIGQIWGASTSGKSFLPSTWLHTLQGADPGSGTRRSRARWSCCSLKVRAEPSSDLQPTSPSTASRFQTIFW